MNWAKIIAKILIKILLIYATETKITTLSTIFAKRIASQTLIYIIKFFKKEYNNFNSYIFKLNFIRSY
jgi:hypothetical protein